jgi:uncharacterized membrane protein YgcG
MRPFEYEPIGRGVLMAAALGSNWTRNPQPVCLLNMRHSRRLAAAVLVPLLLLGAASPPVRAVELPQLEDAVTDLADALGDREAEVEQATAQLLDDHDVQLFVLFIRTTDGTPMESYAEDVAVANSLGTNDVILVVAVDDHTYQIIPDVSLDDEIDSNEADVLALEIVEPRLREGDFAGGAIGLAHGLQDAVTSTFPPRSPDGGGGVRLDGLGTVLGVLLLFAGIGLVGYWIWNRRRAQLAEEERDRRTGRLAREANALLIATDERVRNATQEVGFVEAEYGAAEATPLRNAIEAARVELREAFAIRQKLDDAEPDPPETREQYLNDIVTRSKRANELLDAETERIERLRDMERDATQILAALPDRIAAGEARLPDAERTSEEFARYAPSTSQPVNGNLAEARKGLTGARDATQRGSTALSSGDRRGAARAAATAEEGLAGATRLLDAIDKLAATARDAEDKLEAELSAADADLGEARRALAGAPVSSRKEEQVRIADAALRDARFAAARAPLDPIEGLRLATVARRAANELLAAAREDAEQRAKFAAAVDASLTTAAATVDRVADYIAARRGGVGRMARTRLSEAERQLETARALRERDPDGALQAARRAEALAGQAYSAAGSDFDRWNQGGPGWGGRRGGGGDQVGAVLGGILTGILLGGGRGGGGGGWGGSPWGSPGPTGGGDSGGGWGGGGSRGGNWGGFGGFGGGGGGGGGGFGGGRSRGGRW